MDLAYASIKTSNCLTALFSLPTAIIYFSFTLNAFAFSFTFSKYL